MTVYQKINHFFDKLEDKVRGRLSHHPLVYSFIGGVGIVLFWKGVWETAEYYPSLHGVSSLLLGALIMLPTGLFVSFFIGDSIILSGIKHEKKIVEKTEAELRAETVDLKILIARLDSIEKKLDAQIH
ncbi:hypothetical protein A2419_02495 [Candidatus Adlerbacteria bacterium RIFOXYC1_FULL_48_26]|uniref:Uncharacterized protein n=1 Tax=Candidatus Adlerbacteria bacterium RIFOXYC1_FULL_48_26 TaxID=1797247 RepID=A0A1F4Y4R7_9BACT|nr:MAG: hypothetical protein A2419_02495 [Candidatus Adlerbacteria bacterium RIFOXYC1_FULL_48_26]